MITLRPDQAAVLDAVREAFRSHQSVLVQCATGWGKTALATVIAKGASEKRRRVIFSVHRRQLVTQTALTFQKVGLDYGYVASGFPANPFASVQIATVGTLGNRLARWMADLLVVDEGHLAAAPTWRKVIDHYRGVGAKILILSATPTRLDGKPLSGIADTMICGPSVRWLMDQRILSAYKAYAPVSPDMAGMHTRAGDYVPAELTERFDKPTVIGDAITAWRKYAYGKRTIAFAFSRKHGRNLCGAYNQAGIPAVYVDGETPDDERRLSIGRLADGDARIIVGVNLFTEGFDLSSQVGREVPIEAGAFLRPTKSLALAMQMVGRTLRRKDSPAILMDHVNLFQEHGLPDAEREWSLDGAVKDKQAGERTIQVTICHACMAVVRPAYKCSECGAVRQVNGREIDIREGELQEIDIERLREHHQFVAQKIEERGCKSLADWERLAAIRGFKRGWAWHRWQLQQRKAAGRSARIDKVFDEHGL